MDPKKLFLEHFEKLALGVAGVLLLGFFAFSVLGETPAEAESAKVDRYNKNISAKLQTARSMLERHRRSEPKPKYLDAVRQELSGGPLPVAFPDWLLHKRPLVATKVYGVDVPEPEHLPPVEFKGAPGLGRIALSWQENGQNRLVVVERYVVFRREGKAGEWVQVAEQDGAVHSYVDSEAEPRKDYWYRLESRATIDEGSPTVERHKIELPEEKRVTVSLEIGPFTTKRDVYLEVVAVQAPTLQDRIEGRTVTKQAWMKVYKYFGEEDAWRVSDTITIKPGEPIGEVQERGGGKIDYTTDYRLVDVEKKDVKEDKGGGLMVSVEAHFAEVRDEKTGETFTINNRDKDPDLEAVKQAMQGGDE